MNNHFGLVWPNSSISGLRATIDRIPLHEHEDEGVNQDITNNLFIEGDNLYALRSLQKDYINKIKMIYIDPPYNTGKKFIYVDKFSENSRDYNKRLLETGEDKTHSKDSSGRLHANWLDMILPRLMLAKVLLKEDGVIFISIDENEQANLKLLCNEVFGEENFLACITWERSSGRKNDSKYFSLGTDYILVYAKDKSSFELKKLPRTDAVNSRYKNMDNDYRGRWCAGSLTAKTYSEKYDYPITTPSGRVVNPCQGSCWRVTKERFQELLRTNRIWFGRDGLCNPTIKRFLSEVQDGLVPTTLWKFDEVGSYQEARKEIRDLFDGKVYFSGTKPVKLLSRIVHISNFKDGDIGLDFFAGSSSTAHAIMDVSAKDGINRKFIMVQLPELCDEKSDAFNDGYKNLADISKERIRRAGKRVLRGGYHGKWNRDVGFKVLKYR